MNDLRIRHRVQLDRRGPRGTCVWCGKDTDIWAETPFRPDLIVVPLHLFCGVFMRDAYRKWQAGEPFDPDEIAGLKRIALLPAGPGGTS